MLTLESRSRSPARDSSSQGCLDTCAADCDQVWRSFHQGIWEIAPGGRKQAVSADKCERFLILGGPSSRQAGRTDMAQKTHRTTAQPMS
jgi:hypothetical protein